MSRTKKGILACLTFFLLIQLAPPNREASIAVLPGDDFNRVFQVPEDLRIALNTSCYDCHSNRTRYPWYADLQPIGWWMAGHIKEAKQELNFNEFGSYSKRKQESKLKAIANSIKDDSMPIASYTLIHRNAILSAEDKTMLSQWLDHTIDSLSNTTNK